MFCSDHFHLVTDLFGKTFVRIIFHSVLFKILFFSFSVYYAYLLSALIPVARLLWTGAKHVQKVEGVKQGNDANTCVARLPDVNIVNKICIDEDEHDIDYYNQK